MPVPRISVVVPFHNNEDLLGDCLKSIAVQSFSDFEVIMVDDGSADGSAKIAAAQAAADPRFTLIQVSNGGPGYARNHGIRRASGEYLSFVDADDALPVHALEHMLHTLEQSGSDFVSGGVLRLGPAGINPSHLHGLAIKTRKIGTHISRSPELFFDVSVWNKLFRRSFWDSRDLVFPEGVVWEDLQLITKAHVMAEAVDTIPEPIYYWRERGTGALSITQSRTSIANLRDRITALLVIDDFLRQRRPAKMVSQHQRKALANDLWLYVPDLGRTSEEYRAEFAKLAASYLAQVDRRVLRQLPATHKLAYHLIGRGMLPELLEYVGWLNQQQVRTVPIVREHGRIRADLPFRKDSRLGIPASIYAPQWRELDPFVRVERIDWQDGKLVIAGCAFVPSIDIRKRRHTSKIVVLVPRSRARPPVIVPARSFRHAQAKQWSLQDRYDYDWAGFRCAISPRWFHIGTRWLTGDWEGYVLVRARGVWRAARLHTPVQGSAERPVARQVAPGIRLGVRWLGRRLHVQVVKTLAELRRCDRAGGDLVLEVEAELPDGQRREAADQAVSPGQGALLVLARPAGSTTRELATTVTQLAAGRFALRAIVPAELLLEGASHGHGTGLDAGPDTGQAQGAAEAGAQQEWDVCVQPAGADRFRVAFAADGDEYSYPAGSGEIAVERTRYGNVVIVRRGLRPVIEEHSWSDDGSLTLRGRYPGLAATAGALEGVLARNGATEVHLISVASEADRAGGAAGTGGTDRAGSAAGIRFSLTIAAAAMPSFGRRQPLRDGIWQLTLRQVGQSGERSAEVAPSYEHAKLADFRDQTLQFGPKNYRFTTTGFDLPMLEVSTALRLAEHGRIQRRVLREMYYPLQQRRQLRDAVVFVSFKGKQASDNPLGIAAELRRRGDDREHVWVVNDWAVPVPEGARPVLIGTEAYWEALGRSRYLISNDDMPAAYEKRAGQVYVQTWHGTPLKRIGYDVEQLQSVSGGKYLDHLARDIARWDLLLSPNPFSTPILRNAFRFTGDICESGYPRNDVLRASQDGLLAAEVRRRIGLPAGKRVVLYAPTWRDNQYYASGRYRFDFRLDIEHAWAELGDDYVILVRGHHHMSDDVPDGIRPGFLINVTAYPDAAELFLVSDALITDYSSMMCDFSATRKPMLFYTYDLADYRDNLRGFYLDFEAEVPGPLLATSAEVIGAIGELDVVAERYRAKYEAFAAKFSPLDDGKAGARACDRIFGS
jgi:CDP-glycerol glycerophosphotransferase